MRYVEEIKERLRSPPPQEQQQRIANSKLNKRAYFHWKGVDTTKKRQRKWNSFKVLVVSV